MMIQTAIDPKAPAISGFHLYDQTTAGLLLRGGPSILYIGGYLIISGIDPQVTASCRLLRDQDLFSFVCLDSTSAGTEASTAVEHDTSAIGNDRSAAEYVHSLRKLSGLTWDQLARIFDVSRRTIHLWASGKPMAIGNETKVHRLTAFIEKIDRGDARLNRTALLSVREDGVSVLELLRLNRYSEAESVVGRGAHRVRRQPLVPISAEARDARKPPGPANLMGAPGEIMHKRRGRLVRNLSRPLKRPK